MNAARLVRSWLPLLLCWFCAASSRASDFDAGNRLYDQGKYAEAKAAYEKAAASREWSANLFYNLGNANHRLDREGEAALGYERALTLDPGHPEAQANLKLVWGKTGAIPWPESWRDRVIPGTRPDLYAVVGCVAGWAAIFMVVAIFSGRRRDGSGFWFGLVAAVTIAGCSAAAVWQLGQRRELAIVTAKSAAVHMAPAESATVASDLPAGSEVRVLSERGDWVYCALPTQGRGWLPAKALERVRLGDT